MQPRTTAAYYVQAVLSFALATAALAIGIARLPVDAWMRAFLAVALLYVITSAFTLAKVVRDRQDAGELVSRVDQARLENRVVQLRSLIETLDLLYDAFGQRRFGAEWTKELAKLQKWLQHDDRARFSATA